MSKSVLTQRRNGAKKTILESAGFAPLRRRLKIIP
jgi:hypothetical protein